MTKRFQQSFFHFLMEFLPITSDSEMRKVTRCTLWRWGPPSKSFCAIKYVLMAKILTPMIFQKTLSCRSKMIFETFFNSLIFVAVFRMFERSFLFFRESWHSKFEVFSKVVIARLGARVMKCTCAPHFSQKRASAPAESLRVSEFAARPISVACHVQNVLSFSFVKSALFFL